MAFSACWRWQVFRGASGGGIVVSMKIGGGNNLHNVIAFLVLFSNRGEFMSSLIVLPTDHYGTIVDCVGGF